MNEKGIDLRGARLLLVDDVPTNLDVLCALLEGADYRISIAPDGAIALRLAAQTAPDLILLDVVMPEMNGFEVCRRLKQDPKTEHIPVIFITAENQTEGVVEGFEAGGVDYIAKPFQDAEVLVRVKTHLSLSRLTRELETKSTALEEKNQSLSEANEALVVANQKIQEVSRYKSEFLARMSHDLRTPMNAIIGYTRILLRRTREVLEERHYRNLENIEISANHLLNLINDILDLSKIEAGRMEIQFQDVDLQQLVEECAMALSSLLRDGVQLERQLEDVEPLRTDPNLLRRVLMNLLSNAVKFTEQGRIDLRLRSIEGGLEVVVADTGPGIPAAELPHIFDEFHRVEGGKKGGPEGTGLGLAIARKSVNLLGGRLAVESQTGRGTKFTLTIEHRK